jgi:hypothetical protein
MKATITTIPIVDGDDHIWAAFDFEYTTPAF